MNIITPSRLSKLKSFIPIDATWYMPNSGKDGAAEFLEKRLPKARFFDLDAIKSESPYPHMMPSKQIFEQHISKMSINNDDTLVIYDKGNLFSSPRVYWMFETFGHKNVYLLDNYADYKSELETSEPFTPQDASDYTVPSVGHWIEFEEMEKISKDSSYVILDARPADRFHGKAPEPRAGLSNGHIPGAISFPAGQVLENGHYKSPETINQMLEDAGVDTSKQVVCMCGSGVTACIIKYAVDGHLSKPALVYDGSWTEWAQRSDYIESASTV